MTKTTKGILLGLISVVVLIAIIIVIATAGIDCSGCFANRNSDAGATEVPATEVPATEVPATEVPATEAPQITEEPEPTKWWKCLNDDCQGDGNGENNWDFSLDPWRSGATAEELKAIHLAHLSEDPWALITTKYYTGKVSGSQTVLGGYYDPADDGSIIINEAIGKAITDEEYFISARDSIVNFYSDLEVRVDKISVKNAAYIMRDAEDGVPYVVFLREGKEGKPVELLCLIYTFSPKPGLVYEYIFAIHCGFQPVNFNEDDVPVEPKPPTPESDPTPTPKPAATPTPGTSTPTSRPTPTPTPKPTPTPTPKPTPTPTPKPPATPTPTPSPTPTSGCDPSHGIQDPGGNDGPGPGPHTTPTPSPTPTPTPAPPTPTPTLTPAPADPSDPPGGDWGGKSTPIHIYGANSSVCVC